MNWQEQLASLEACVSERRMEEASALLDTIDAKDENDVQIHERLAQFAEQVGDGKRALLEYNLVLREQPDRPDALRRLLSLHMDRGEMQQAEKACRRLLELCPDDRDANLALGRFLEATGQLEEARDLYQGFLDQGENPEILEAFERVQRASRAPLSHVEPWLDGRQPAPEDSAATEPTDLDAVVLAHIFAGREGVYARQWRSDTGKHGYTPIYEPFTTAVARNHLLGNYTVGIYPVRMDNTVLFLAFDLDIARFAMSQQARSGDTRGLESLLQQVHSAACRLLDVATMYELPVYLEDSGWKGRHVWLFFEEPVPAAAARRLANWLLHLAGAFSDDVHVEVFPKQSRLAQDKLGNLIKLPLGIHRVTGRRCLFVDTQGRSSSSPFSALHQIQRVSRERLRELLAGIEAEAAWSQQLAASQGEQKARSGSTHGVRAPMTPVPPTALPATNGNWPATAHTAMPQEIPYQHQDDIEFQWLLRGCHVLRRIVQQAGLTSLLSREEQHVVTYTVGHLSHGAEAVNQVLMGLLNVEPRALLKSSLRGSPMSCPKIRSRVPEIAAAVDCHCQFAPDVGMYPTPLLHLHELRARGTLAAEPTQLSPLQVERMIADLFRARRDHARLQKLIQDMEARMRAIMTEQQVTSLHTAAGTIHLQAQGQLVLSVGATDAIPIRHPDHQHESKKNDAIYPIPHIPDPERPREANDALAPVSKG